MKLRLFVILLMLSLTVVGCADSGMSGEDPVLPYDYDEAAEKLKKHCAGFPTTFGIDEDSSEYEHAKDTFEELQKGGMIIL